MRNFCKFSRGSLTPSGLLSVLYRLLFLYLKAQGHRDGHSYCSSQGCERVRIQAATDSKETSNCMAKAYPQYYRKPSALKRMPAMLTKPCQGCGTHQVNQWTVAWNKVGRFFAVGAFWGEASILPICKCGMISPELWPIIECDAPKKQPCPNYNEETFLL